MYAERPMCVSERFNQERGLIMKTTFKTDGFSLSSHGHENARRQLPLQTGNAFDTNQNAHAIVLPRIDAEKLLVGVIVLLTFSGILPGFAFMALDALFGVIGWWPLPLALIAAMTGLLRMFGLV